MKHCLILFCAAAFLSGGTAISLFAQSQTQSKMLNTKHNLSASGPGTIKATTEKDICVFCHTPHVPKEYGSAQLWNHKSSTSEYTLYTSDYLKSLTYTAPNQPNLRSKLCLSCHDGTIAVGEVYNNEGVSSITMQNNVTTMPETSPGNLGTSLTNDHPVGYLYDNTKDPELVARTWPWETPVKLDPDAATGTVECITCHEPHDDTYTKFLRMDNTDAALCGFCHQKTGWAESAHKNSTQFYQSSEDANPTTVGEWACRSCHQSHGGPSSQFLLSKAEEQTCFTSGCHGNTLTGKNTKNIQSEYDKLYAHPTILISGKHKNPDDDKSLGVLSRHAECQDCHNSHRARTGLHTPGSNTISEVLKGTRGVISQGAHAWEQPKSFVEANPVVQENQICYKCHSYYGFGDAVNGVTTIIGPSGEYMTDQAMEFNPANSSAHPVQVSLDVQDGSPMPRALTATQMTGDWSMVGSQTMYCSDCHGNDQVTSASVPQGPHGSNVRFMLTGTAKYWPLNASGNLWTLWDVKKEINNWRSDLFCVNCHPIYNGVTFTNNVHEATAHQDEQVKCITCHVTVPHGSKRSRLIGYSTDVKPYNYLGAGKFEKLVINGFEKAAAPNLYMINNCSMNTSCHGTQIGNYEQ
ncbi:MAG: hypothetical protein EPO24_16215 [Bacteroidetes bacterium]|nr:MAG: hypothetical protein EPO24_16215 [Bacteroidota bacterium]